MEELSYILNQNPKRLLRRVLPQSVGGTNNLLTALNLLIDKAQTLSAFDAKQELCSVKCDSSQNTVLHLAAKLGDIKNVERILQIFGYDQKCVDNVNVDSFSALHLAAKFGHLEVVKMLLAAKANAALPASVQNRKWAPIHYAAQFGYKEIIEEMVNAGVDIEVKTSFGLTPLVVASEFGQDQVVDFLLKKGAEKNVQTIAENYGMNSLHYAAIGNFKEVVFLLLEAGVDKNKLTKNGYSALDFAARKNHLEILRIFLSWGCGEIEQALEIARHSNNSEAVSLIENYINAIKKLFNLKWLETKGAFLSKALQQFDKDNLQEQKIVFSSEVVFNAFGILSLKNQVGVLIKSQQTLEEFAFDNGMNDLSHRLEDLNKMVKNRNLKN